MRLVRTAVVLAVAGVVLLIGLNLLARHGAAVGTVYDTEARGPKVTFDGGPQFDRAPRFRILVGTSRKTAKWVQVNPLRYAGCDINDQWNGQLCAAAPHLTGSLQISGRAIALGLICVTMLIVPLAAGITTGRRHE